MEHRLILNRLSALVLSFCLIVACDDRLSIDVTTWEQSEIVLNAHIPADVPSDTRSTVSGVTFPINETIGLFLTCHDSTQTPPTVYSPHQIGTNNIKATVTKTGWVFYNNIIKSTVNSFFISTRHDSIPADIFAYAPFKDSVRRPDSIQFSHSLNIDLMYALENSSLTVNKKIIPQGPSIVVPLEFHHALSRLLFGFKIEHYGINGSNHMMDYIHILKSGNHNTPIYESGWFNAIGGTFYAMVQAQDSICIQGGRTNYGSLFSPGSHDYFSDSTAFRYYDVMLYPTDYQDDGDLTVVFSIDGFRHTYTINKVDVEHRDTMGNSLSPQVFGFKKGYTYTFNFIFDNYVHLQNIEIKSEWTPGIISGNI